MNLFIRLKNGQPFEHPIFEDNFKEVWPDVDLSNLPEWVARFERVAAPTVGMFEVNDGVTYEWVDGIVKDVWHVRAMTDDEKQEKLQSMSDAILVSVDWLKQEAATKLQEATTDEIRSVWQTYLDAITAWKLVDPLTDTVPVMPRISADGNLLSTSSAGTAPDVIG